jgi:RNA polymerase sigma factor (sigma-70 family)
MPDAEPGSQPSRAEWFVTTRWSVVLAAGGDSTRAGAALERLCGAYWYPLYAFARRSGQGAQDAEDLVQSFFAACLAGGFLGRAEQAKGRFRSYLLVAFKRFAANEWAKARTQRRGGAGKVLALDALTAEERYAVEPADVASPEKLFERRWALTLLEQVLAHLEAEQTASGNAKSFAVLKEFLTDGGRGTSHEEVGRRLGLSAGAVKVAVHRLRKRYRELLEEEIAHTVTSPDEVEEERRHLLAALGG